MHLFMTIDQKSGLSKSQKASTLRIIVMVVKYSCLLLQIHVTFSLLCSSCILVQRMSCPDQWAMFEDYCYWFETQEASWNDAEAICNLEGANLVSITSEAEQSYIICKFPRIMFLEVCDTKYYRYHRFCSVHT